MFKDKKGQIDFPIIGIVVVALALFIIAPTILMIMNNIQAPMSASLGNMTYGTTAQENLNYVYDFGNNWIDKLVVTLFAIAVIVMIISAFFVDASPIFIILYLLMAFLTVIFSPNIIGALDKMYASQAFNTAISNLSWTVALRDNFMVFLVGLIVITGIIMFGKIYLFGGSGGGTGSR